jgi:tripartite motif-containing protein 2/3
MASSSSPTPSIDSLPGATSNSNSIEEPALSYLSDSPLTTGSSSIAGSSSAHRSDSGICDEFLSTKDLNNKTIIDPYTTSDSKSLAEAIVQSAASVENSLLQVPNCTGCSNKKSDAVAKCIDCINYLCSNCVLAHQYMHCFSGHSVFRLNHLSTNNINNLTDTSPFTSNLNSNPMMSSQQNVQKINLTSDRLISSCGGKDDTGQVVKSMLNSIISLPSLNDNSLLMGSQMTLNNENGLGNMNNKPSRYYCVKHPSEIQKFYCRTCSTTVCKDCMVIDHPAGVHDCEHNSDPAFKMIDVLQIIMTELRSKAHDMKQMVKNSETNSTHIQIQYHKAQSEINETYQFYRSMLDERKQELLKELDSFYNAKTMSQSVLLSKSQDQISKVLTSCDYVDKFSRNVGLNELQMLKRIMETKLQAFISSYNDLQSIYELEFVSNYQAIQVGVRNTFGYIRSSSESGSAKQPPIARPSVSNGSSNGLGGGASPPGSNGNLNMMMSHNNIVGHNGMSTTIERPFSNGGSSNNSAITTSSSPNQSHANFESGSLLNKRFNSISSLGPFMGNNEMSMNNTQQAPSNTMYEKWSNGISDSIFSNNSNEQYSSMGLFNSGANNNLLNLGSSSAVGNTDSILDITSKLMSTNMFPPKSQIKRHKMIYHCKFGEFGVMEGQFTEPSGVAVNAQNDIIVADTNNHRIQIFDKEGRFKFQFGECGKRDGQLLYPNRVAVVRTSGDIIVTERSPTHQIQIYNQYGQFVRKFGANILQHPRGVTVDNKGRIIVVECKVMRVIIFDQNGNVLQKFGCSKHLEFPNGVVVNDKQEIFISDNRAHCVKVFNYEGTFLRQIGGEGITNYPIGVGINSNGEILIADNHNNFNLTIFTQDGQLVSALESKVKHAQCFDVALMDDGSVVLASKDYRLYIYRYIQVPPIGL